MVIPYIIGGGVLYGALSERYAIPYTPNVTELPNLMNKVEDNVKKAAFQQALELIETEEGFKDTVYLDTLGYPTVGWGHKVLPEDGLKLGDKISIEKAKQFLAKDLNAAFDAAVLQANECGKFNSYFIARLTSVNYQLGIYWRTKFPNTWSYIKAGNLPALKSALYNSAWYKQTPNRVIAFYSDLETYLA